LRRGALGRFPGARRRSPGCVQILKAGQHSQALERVNKVLKRSRAIRKPLPQGHHCHEQGNSKEAIEIFTRLTQDYRSCRSRTTTSP